MARMIAVQGLYEMELAGASIDDVVMTHMENRWADQPEALPGVQELPVPDRKKFADIVRGVTKQRAKLDEMIAGALTSGQSVERLDVILGTILRAGAYELFAHPKVPAKVVINEYVNVTQAFYDDREPALVNGVLDHIAQLLRPSEVNRPKDSPGESE